MGDNALYFGKSLRNLRPAIVSWPRLPFANSRDAEFVVRLSIIFGKMMTNVIFHSSGDVEPGPAQGVLPARLEVQHPRRDRAGQWAQGRER